MELSTEFNREEAVTIVEDPQSSLLCHMELFIDLHDILFLLHIDNLSSWNLSS